VSVSPSSPPPLTTWQRLLQVWAGQGEPPEESRLLRALVQAMATLGIGSVTVAALGVTPTSLLNLLAIPASALGGYWSWRRRHRKNVTAKFVIALGMLCALGIFFARLIGRGGDTRILLAELLIHLLVFHSFDMPRRKDLGYAMVIGLILLGVAATVSQTFTLAPLLLLFLAIALPVMVLDYRSRLGFKGWQRNSLQGSHPLRRLAILLGVTVLLGLGIFAALPRLPGYQIQNFPVSGNIDFQGDFTGNQIVQPGAGSDDAEVDLTGDTFEESGTLEGPGQVDDSFYYGFSRRMNQNLRGSLTPQVLLRVRAQAIGFWRVMAFDHYTGQGWEISQEDRVEVVPRSFFSYETFLPAAAYRVGNNDVEKADLREVIQTYTVVNPIQNVIPALYQAKKLYFPTREVAVDSEGGLRSPIPLSPGLTYTVVSRVPQRDRTALGQASTTYPSYIQDHYLEVPAEIRDRLRQTAQDLFARLNSPPTNAYETALALAQALKQNYSLQPELPFFGEDDDLVSAFLYQYEGGYPDHFSTVLTVMLRSLGIPARLVAGFAPGEFNPFTGYYVVRNVDAYAMTEVFFPGYGWFAFDPIPGHEVIPPSIRDSQTFSVLRQFWHWVAGWLPSPVAGLLSDSFLLITQWLSRLVAFLSQGWLQALAGLIGATALGFGGWLAWLGWRRWRQQRWLGQLPPVERVYQQVLTWLAHQGFPKAPHQTPLEYVAALQQADGPAPDHLHTVQAIVAAYVRWRYGGQPQDVTRLQTQARSLWRRSRPSQ
jgi:transglutaminase-like putative cysteine protease